MKTITVKADTKGWVKESDKLWKYKKDHDMSITQTDRGFALYIPNGSGENVTYETLEDAQVVGDFTYKSGLALEKISCLTDFQIAAEPCFAED